jgi:hypothetical protein
VGLQRGDGVLHELAELSVRQVVENAVRGKEEQVTLLDRKCVYLGIVDFVLQHGNALLDHTHKLVSALRD